MGDICETGPPVYSSYPRTCKSNHLQMSLQRQHFLLSYLKTPSDGRAGVELTTSRMAARCSTNFDKTLGPVRFTVFRNRNTCTWN